MKFRVLSVALAAGVAVSTAAAMAQAPASQQPTQFTADWVMGGAPIPMTTRCCGWPAGVPVSVAPVLTQPSAGRRPGPSI